MEQTINFNKPRSIKACVIDAWRIGALNWRNYLKALWPHLLLLGITVSLFVEVAVRYATQHLLPAYKLMQYESEPKIIQYVATPNLSLGVCLLIAFICFLIGIYNFEGRLYYLIQRYSETDQFETASRIKPIKEARNNSSRLLRCDALFMLCTILLLLTIGFAALKLSLWISILLPCLCIYSWSTANVARMQYAFGRKPLGKALKFAFRRSMGMSFMVQFITFIPAVLLWLIFGMPAIIYLLTEIGGHTSALMGDATGLPAYLPFIFFILNAGGLALCALVDSVRTWALAMK